MYTEKERLLRVLWGQTVDRPPVICPGGMMNGCVSQVLEQLERETSVDREKIIKAAKLTQELTGFENIGVPFCMTVEAECFGAKVDYGNSQVEPRVIVYREESDFQDFLANPYSFKEEYRVKEVLEAIRKLKNPLIPVIGNLTGAVSTLTSVFDPLFILKKMRKSPLEVETALGHVNQFLIDFGLAMIDAGVDVIAVSDPTATGEILGKANFEGFVVPLYRQLVEAINQKEVPVILHICGNTASIFESINRIPAQGVSFDSVVNMKDAGDFIEKPLIGNVNTQLLHQGSKEQIYKMTKKCMQNQLAIIAPACGLSMATPIEHLKIMTDCVKGKTVE